MNDFYKWAEVPRKRTRKQNKRSRRREKLCRQILVRYAGNHLLCYDDEAGRRQASAPARGWSTRRAVKVPRRLRSLLGRTVGGQVNKLFNLTLDAENMLKQLTMICKQTKEAADAINAMVASTVVK